MSRSRIILCLTAWTVSPIIGAMSPWETIDRLGANLGVGDEARRKWRERGSVPHRWRLPLMEAAFAAGTSLSARDFEGISRPERAPGKAA